MHEEDFELLEIMKELEENDEQTLDNDSVLAPVSSQIGQRDTPIEPHKCLTQPNFSKSDDDEDELDFTMVNFDPQ